MNQATNNFDKVAQQVKGEVGDAFHSSEAAREGAAFEKELLDRAAENFQFMETAYRERKIDLLHFVAIQNDLVTAQFSYVDSLWNDWFAHTALERAVGQDL